MVLSGKSDMNGFVVKNYSFGSVIVFAIMSLQPDEDGEILYNNLNDNVKIAYSNKFRLVSYNFITNF